MPDNLLSNITAYSQSSHTEDLDQFVGDLFKNSESEYVTFSFPIESIDPLAYLEMCWNNKSFQYYWEQPVDEFAIAAGGSLLNITAAGANRFTDVNTKFEEIRESASEYSVVSHPYSGMLFLGGFSFADQINEKRWQSFEPASFTVPKWMIVKDGKFTIATIAVETHQFESPGDLQQYLHDQLQKIEHTITQNTNGTEKEFSKRTLDTPSPQNGAGLPQWTSSVSKAKKLIQQQVFDKIVLARDVSISKNGDTNPTQILNKLRQKYSNCYNFLIHNPSKKTFLGSTPERLGAFRNQLLLTDALAGSIQRGKTATEDTVLEKHLSGSSKNQNEHHFVIKDIEDRLEPFVKKIDRNERPEIKKLSNVQHLYTAIRAQLKDDTNILEVLSHLHPTPAVGGYPWKNSAPYIDELEDFDRGWYAGPVGWFNTNGIGEFAVAIRSGLFTESKAHFFAGCGIVEDSDPKAEWEETNLKLKPMLSALQYD